MQSVDASNRAMIDLIDKYGSFEAMPKNPMPVLKVSSKNNLSSLDPKGRLSDIADKVAHIEGNANLEDAQVILLPDLCHLDEEHKRWRGEIGTRVKWASNIILCEGADSHRWNLSTQEKQHALGEGFKLGYDDYVTGWDNGYLHKASLQEIKSCVGSFDVQQIEDVEALLNDTQFSPENISPDTLAQLMTMAKKIQSTEQKRQKVNEMADDRTCNLGDSIEQKISTADGARIIVDGGSGHLLDPSLLDRLRNKGIKFCAITAKLGPKGQELQSSNSLSSTFAAVKDYYR